MRAAAVTLLFAITVGQALAADLTVNIGRSDNPSPVVHLTIAGTDIAHLYRVTRNLDINANNWTLIGTQPGASNMTLFDDTTIGSATKAFYQILPVLPVAIPRTTWAAPIVDSQEDSVGGGSTPGTNATDGNPSTFWHTEWYPPENSHPGLPHHIDVDMGANFSVAGFRHLPRQDGVENGRIAQYEFYVSTDGSSWGMPVATGTFVDIMDETQVLFVPVTARWVRLKAISSYPLGTFVTSLAELTVLTDKIPQPKITSPSTDVIITVGDSVTLSGTATDLNPNPTFSYLWTFDPASGVPNSIAQNPGATQFNTSGTFTVTFSATDSLGLTGSTTRTVTVLSSAATSLSRAGWTLVSADSQETTAENGSATNAFDGDTSTYWHTRYTEAQDPYPHDIIINLGAAHNISGLRHLPRQDMINGRIEHYKFYVTNETDMSGTPINWGSPVTQGLLPDTSLGTEVHFSPKLGQYIWLRAEDAWSNTFIASLAELNVLTND